MLGVRSSFPSLLLVLAGHAFGQTDSLTYRRIVDFREVFRGSPGSETNEDFRIVDLSISADRWVALVAFLKIETDSVLISGDLTRADVSVRRLQYRPERAVLDGRNRIYLLGTQRRPDWDGDIFVLEENGSLRQVAQITGAELIPLRSGGEVLWSSTEGVWREHNNAALKIKRRPLTKELFPEVENERRLALGLPLGSHLILRDRSESVTVYDDSGGATSTAVLRFDHAYASIGRTSAPVDIHRAGDGRTRVIWATTSAAGELFIGLADTPVVGPGYVAVFNPLNGKFIRMLSLALPKGIASRVFSENPDGTMSPLTGSVYERLVTADPEAGIVAFY